MTRKSPGALVAGSTANYGYAPPVSAYLSVWVSSPAKAIASTDLTVDAARFVFGRAHA